VSLNLGLAFAAGVISFASTCVLPLVPAYITYIGGRAVTDTLEPTLRQQLRVLGNASLFVLGFSTAFVALGASAGLVGANLRTYRVLLLQIAGAALVLIGISLLGLIRFPWLMQERRFDIAHRLPRAPWASYIVGLAFAIGWTPCVGPILAAILTVAGDEGTAGQGAILLGAYSAGLGVPFLLAAGLAGLLSRAMARLQGAYAALNAVAAVFLIVMGLLIFSNRLTQLNSLVPYFDLTQLEPRLRSAQSQTLPTNVPLHPGDPAPTFRLTDLDGQSVALASLRGRPVLISFWATWCAPCREELPVISAAYEAHRQQGFAVLAVNFGQEAPEAMRRYWSEAQLTPAPFPDPAGTVSTAYGVGLQTTGLPVNVLIDRQGRISRYIPFPLDRELLDAQLQQIL